MVTPLTNGRPKMRSRKPNKAQRLALCEDVKAMSTKKFPDDQEWMHHPPADLASVATWFATIKEGRDRFGWVLRDALDELLDGERTGRWAYDQLGKTEKTHLGSIIEIKLSREFEIPAGDTIDWKIGSDEVDCKFSRQFGGWEIPIEMYLPEPAAPLGTRAGQANHAALVVWMNDDREQWAAGLVRIKNSILRTSNNRDRKRKIRPERMDQVHWLWGGRQDDLPRNLFLAMTTEQRRRVFAPGSGQRRVNEMFRILEGSLVPRAVVSTAGIQEDPMKRARDARLPRHLGNSGFLILGHSGPGPVIAGIFGLPVPTKGEFVPVRIVPAHDQTHRTFVLHGQRWRRATPDDAESPSPNFPSTPPAGTTWTEFLQVSTF
jgi:hypothetical protein